MSSFINTVASPKLLQMPQDIAKSTAQKGHLDGRKVTVIVFSSIALATVTAACVVAALKISLFIAAALLAAAVVSSIVTLIAASKIKTSNNSEKQAHTREVEQLNQKIVELEGTVAKQKQDLDNQPKASTPAAATIDTEQLTKLEDEVKALKKDLSEKTDELNKLKSLPDQKQRIADLENQVKGLQDDLKSKDENVNQLKADLQKAQAAKQANQNNTNSSPNKSRQPSNTVKKLENSASEKLITLGDEYNKLNDKYKKLEESNKLDIKKLVDEKAQLEKAKQEAENKIEKLKSEKEEAVDKLTKQLKTLENSLVAQQQILKSEETNKDNIIKLKNEIEELKADHEKQLKALVEEKILLEKQLDNLKQQAESEKLKNDPENKTHSPIPVHHHPLEKKTKEVTFVLPPNNLSLSTPLNPEQLASLREDAEKWILIGQKQPLEDQISILGDFLKYKLPAAVKSIFEKEKKSLEKKISEITPMNMGEEETEQQLMKQRDFWKGRCQLESINSQIVLITSLTKEIESLNGKFSKKKDLDRLSALINELNSRKDKLQKLLSSYNS